MKDTALLVIDVQKAFEDSAWGQRNNLNAEDNISSLLSLWRKNNSPVIHIHHSSELPISRFHPSKIGHEAKEEAAPLADEPVFKKIVNSAFIGTELEQYLSNEKIEKLVVVGLTTDHCVSTSVRMAANLGFDVTLVSDGTATFNRQFNGIEYTAQQIHTIHLASLNEEFCRLTTTTEILNKD